MKTVTLSKNTPSHALAPRTLWQIITRKPRRTVCGVKVADDATEADGEPDCLRCRRSLGLPMPVKVPAQAHQNVYPVSDVQ